jgi:ABC-2 type transport system permease protein
MRVGAFARKEAVDILHQPRLLLTLVAGPFLILLLFGLGYRQTTPPMRTVFVVPEGSPFGERVEQYSDQLGPAVRYEGTTTDADAARRRLLDGKVDLVVGFPDDPLQTVLDGKPAPITVEHTRLDPIQQTAIDFAARLAVDEIDSEILARIVGEGQDSIAPYGQVFNVTTKALSTLDAALAAGDGATARKALDDVDRGVSQLQSAYRSSALFVDDLAGGTEVGDRAATASQSLSDTLAGLRRGVDDARARLQSGSVDRPALHTLSEGLTTANRQFDEFTSVEPKVLVRPFVSQVSNALPGSHDITDWYAPAAIILLLQQFGVALAALSFVRERQQGIVDLFRVTPVSAGQSLVGKYLGFLFIGGGVAAVLTVLVVRSLDVPVVGSALALAATVGLTLFASIGLGFVISLMSRNDTQAVQYAMLVLLASLFFSGFFLSLDQLGTAAHVVSWLLPTTYGMRLLRDVMLVGRPLDLTVTLGLAGYGVAMFVLAWYGTRRRLAATG